MSKLSYFIIFIFVLFSCKKESYRALSDLGYDYQPNKLKYWIEYEVDSITFDDNTTPVTIDTGHYFIKEVYDTTYIGASNEELVRVEQYRKNAENDTYQIFHVGHVKFSSNDFQRNFNDLHYKALTFPLRENITWKGNVFINAQHGDPYDYLNDDVYNWDYVYTEVNTPKQIGAFFLDSCVTVQQIDESNLFEKKFAQEIYAKDIGMVYKEIQILNTQQPPSGVPFIDRVDNGFILTYTLKDYKH